MGHCYVDGVRVTLTEGEARQKKYAKEAEAFDGIPTQTTASGRKYRLCPICHVPAWRRDNGYGRMWYSHRKADGTWCNGVKGDDRADGAEVR